MRKYLTMASIVSISLLFTSCVTDEQELIEINKYSPNGAIIDLGNTSSKNNYSVYNFLDKEYIKNQDVTKLQIDTEIYNSENDSEYIRDKYIEGDFAVDLVTEYLKGNKEFYNNLYNQLDDNNNVILATEDYTERLDDSNIFLREQMNIAQGEPIYFKLDKLIYKGATNDNNDELIFEVRGYLSAYSDYFVSISTYTVTVVKENGIIYGNIN